METPTKSRGNPGEKFKRKKNQNIPNKMTIFLDGSSIRGMQKIVKANSLFLRVLWICFVFSMSSLLFIASVFLVRDYVRYRTVWNTSTKLDDQVEFPAITFCSHNPFSTEANKLWKSEDILSPTKFRNMLRNITKSFIRLGDPVMGTINLFENTETYYSNLDFNTTTKLGHQNNMILYCLVRMYGYDVVAENCSLDNANSTPFRMRRFSHRNYFNCYTIEAKPNEKTSNTESIIVLLSITPSEDIPETKENLVMGMLTQGEGLKLVVHESDTYPDIDKNGINVQPGKMNELIYSPISWTRHDSPINHCKVKQLPIRDLDRTYQYTFAQCLEATVQRYLINECQCMMNYLPRPYTPPIGHPYCLNFSMDTAALKQRTVCVSDFLNNMMKKVKENAQGKVCLPRCNFFTYDTSLSVTKWKPSPLKFFRINDLYQAADKFSINPNDTRAQQEYINVLYQSDNSAKKIAKFNQLFGNEDRFTYVSLTRKNTDTTSKEEQLVLDIYILLSRIGGLCSLCIGLTTAFFIELVEFAYLAIRAEQQRRKLLSIRRRQHTKDRKCIVLDNGCECSDVAELWKNRYNNTAQQSTAFNKPSEEVSSM